MCKVVLACLLLLPISPQNVYRHVAILQCTGWIAIVPGCSPSQSSSVCVCVLFLFILLYKYALLKLCLSIGLDFLFFSLLVFVCLLQKDSKWKQNSIFKIVLENCKSFSSWLLKESSGKWGKLLHEIFIYDGENETKKIKNILFIFMKIIVLLIGFF